MDIGDEDHLGTTNRPFGFAIVYGEPETWVMLVGVTVNTYSFPVELLRA
jgi:hypothetical protein